jgi:hypothetical protein
VQTIDPIEGTPTPVARTSRAQPPLRAAKVSVREDRFWCTLSKSQTPLALSSSQDARMGTRLYVSNLPLSTTEELLTIRFRQFGVVVSVALEAMVPANRRGAFIEMKTSWDAQRAINGLNLSDFDGRLVSVYHALAGVPARL